eukprot:8322278-Prorocentrum_lima.AAC.1
MGWNFRPNRSHSEGDLGAHTHPGKSPGIQRHGWMLVILARGCPSTCGREHPAQHSLGKRPVRAAL